MTACAKIILVISVSVTRPHSEDHRGGIIATPIHLLNLHRRELHPLPPETIKNRHSAILIFASTYCDA
jgi:hypothetical protein